MKTHFALGVISLIVLLFLTHLSTGSGPVTWSDCTGNKSHALMKIEKIVVNPPADLGPGEGFTLDITFSLNEALQGGKVQVDIQYGVLHSFSATYDMCDQLKKAKLNCPLDKGTNHGLFQGRVPFPHGQFIFTINATTLEGKEVSCFTLKMNDNL